MGVLSHLGTTTFYLSASRSFLMLWDVLVHIQVKSKMWQVTPQRANPQPVEVEGLWINAPSSHLSGE